MYRPCVTAIRDIRNVRHLFLFYTMDDINIRKATVVDSDIVYRLLKVMSKTTIMTVIAQTI